jgi:hypothetical protein
MWRFPQDSPSWREGSGRWPYLLATWGTIGFNPFGGTASDNAHMEAFFHSLKADLVHCTRFLTEAELRTELRRYLK